MSGYVYQQSEPGLFTVGYYEPGTDHWVTDSDHADREAARERCRSLNGGGLDRQLRMDALEQRCSAIEAVYARLVTRIGALERRHAEKERPR